MDALLNSLSTRRGSLQVMRGLKSDETPFFEGNRIYYNFIRPHEGWDGKTPAEAAGVGIKGGWDGLIRQSVKKGK